MTEKTAGPAATRCEIAAWALAGAALLLLLRLRLLPALLAGLLVYELVHVLEPFFQLPRLSGNRAKALVVGLIALALALALALLGWGGVLFYRNEPESVPALLRKMAEILDNLRGQLPGWIVDSVPSDVDSLRDGVVRWLHAHAAQVQTVGREAARGAAQVLIGLVIGALVALREAAPARATGPLGAALIGRAERLGGAFRAVVFAQARIAGLNTLFAALYLGVALPALGVHLPLVKTMIGITFVTGLLPVLGNLVSNAVITVVSLSHSPGAALGSLGYLVVIHKLEYFLNARIIGAGIRAQAWELLVAMLVMEAAFGLPGLVAAPIYYAFLKSELVEKGLV